MRKFLLLALLVVLAYVAKGYFTTGQLPFMDQRTLTEEEQQLKQLHQDFFELRENYFNRLRNSPFEEEITPEKTLRETEKIAKKLDLLRPNLNSEFGKAQAGWLNMNVRKFKKQLEIDETK